MTNQIIETLVLLVSGVVLLQCSHEDHPHETNEEDDHHERIEDREPMDLQNRIQIGGYNW